MSFNGSTLGGSGVVRFDGVSSENSIGVGTVAAGITIHTGTQGGTVGFNNNNGTIAAQTAGKQLVAGGFNWSNAGTLRVDAGKLRLTGTTTTGGLGNIVQTGGVLSIDAEVDNTSATFNTSNYPLFGFLGTIKGGNVSTTARTLLVPSPGDGPFGLSVGRATIAGIYPLNQKLNLAGNVRVESGARLDLDRLVVLNNATIAFTGGGASRLAISRIGASPVTPIDGVGQFTFEGGATTLQLDSAVPLGSGLTFRTKLDPSNVPGHLTAAAEITSGATFSSEVPGGSMSLGGLTSTLRFTNNGAIRATSGGTLALNHLTNNGTIFVGPGSTATVTSTVTNNGTISGGGTISGNVTSPGTIAPGSSPGKLTVSGNLTLTSTSILAIEVGGLTPGVDYDLLDVTGSAALDGVMQITFINGFVPGPTDAFDFFNAASITGAFDDIIFPTLPAGVVWNESAMLTGGPTGVPEPSATLLIVTCVAMSLRRHNSRDATRRASSIHRDA